MPNENKKRGRRAEAQKRKLEEQLDNENDELFQSNYKKRRPVDELAEQRDQVSLETSRPIQQDENEDLHELEVDDAQAHANEPSSRPFYGLLDDSEQEYFRRADDVLQVNQFATREERTLFLENVYKEADGKELKIACSQSCSRLLERLIQLSSPAQLKNLFKKLLGHFLNLVQHRFASHCCETLFVHAAPIVSEELVAPMASKSKDASIEEKLDSMERLYLSAVDELEGTLGYLMTDKFASHALRVLLLVLSGQPLDSTSSNAVRKSKRKENIEVAGVSQDGDSIPTTRIVPDTFKAAVKSILHQSTSGLDTHYLRTLATHKVGNPMLQLLLQLESILFGKQQSKDEKSVIRTLLPEDPIQQDSESAIFINGILYDPIGSHLLEAIIKSAHGKIFKSLYANLFKEQIGRLARNEIASYVVARILERLSHDDLVDAVDRIIPQFSNLAERKRTAIIRTLIERCELRGADTTAIASALQKVYTIDDGTTFSVAELLGLDSEISMPAKAVLTPSDSNSQPAEGSVKKALHQKHRPQNPPSNSKNQSTNASTTHASLLAQAMLQSQGPLSDLMFDSISKLPQELCLHIALTPTLSPILQTSLTVPNAPLIFRRKLITRFYSHMAALSLDPSGSHLVDAILQGTQGLAFVRERIAEELAENEQLLRESPCGRKIWRNWRMDLYRRWRSEWVRLTRESVGNDGFLSFPDGDSGISGKFGKENSGGRTISLPEPSLSLHSGKTGRALRNDRHSNNGPNDTAATGKTKLDLARERYARASRSMS